MKEVKFFEVRDEMTRISAFGMRLGPDDDHNRWHSEDDQYVWQSGGWGTVGPTVFLGRIDGSELHAFHYQWSQTNRTMRTAHDYIAREWDTLTSGQVVDVRVILREASEPAKSDRFSEASA